MIFQVTLTTRQLVSHMGGVRHYYKDYSKYKPNEKLDNKSASNQSDNANLVNSSQSSAKDAEHKKSSQSERQSATSKDKNSLSDSKTKIADQSQVKGGKNNNKESDNEMLLTEYYIKKKYSSVKDSMEIFKSDPLVYKPGNYIFFLIQ